MEDYLSFNMLPADIQQVSILGLAHIGDAVYELMIRSWLLKNGRATAKGLHRASITYVSASAQASACQAIMPLLTPEESAVLKRGRNARVNSVPKRASLEEYHAATALETLVGYLYLGGRRDRLAELFARIIESDGGEQPNAT